MPCYHPLSAWRSDSGLVEFVDRGQGDRLDLPCGRCIGCRLERSRQWATRIMFESQFHGANSFITLTYDEANCPWPPSLQYPHFQKFMKRLRKSSPQPLRFFMCGEYGPLNQRPHYHAIIFGHYFPDRVPAGVSKSGQTYYKSRLLEDLWTHGQCSVQDVNLKSIAYCTRYILDKVSSDDDSLYSSIDADGVIVPRRPEYSACSNNPGIGARWFQLFRSDVFGHDYVVVDGSKFCVPRYYDKLEARHSGKEVFEEEYKFARVELGRSKYLDNTEERLRVREHVHEARVSTLKRDSV